jgi:hypothetical protein
MKNKLAQKQKQMRERGSVYDGRHRNKQQPTVTTTDAEYWEAELQRAGFTMRRGESPHLFYWGMSDAVGEMITRMLAEKHEGRVHPKALMQ